MEFLCTHHMIPVRHLLKDYDLMKKFLRVGFEPSGGKKKDDPPVGADGPDRGKPYQDTNQVLIIFGGPVACESKR